MQKIVINACFGGFSLSHKAVMEYAKIKNIKLYSYTSSRNKDGSYKYSEFSPPKHKKDHIFIHYYRKPLDTKKPDDGDTFYFSNRDIERNDPALVEVVEKLGSDANGSCANLKVVEIPDDVKWEIDEYDGSEQVHEISRKWG